ncbi:hypothetical protein HDU99_010743, partial [Rhizoclosmatium hyalinum]
MESNRSSTSSSTGNDATGRLSESSFIASPSYRSSIVSGVNALNVPRLFGIVKPPVVAQHDQRAQDTAPAQNRFE